MEKGFGIAALIVSILAILVPVVTIYVIWLSLILAAIAGYLGDKAFPIAVTLACLINIAFLSPMTLIALKGENLGGGSSLMVITVILFIAPIAAIIFGATRNKKQAATAE